MRILSLVVSLLVALSVALAAFIYIQHRVGHQRIVVQDHWLSAPEQQAYRSYGDTVPGRP